MKVIGLESKEAQEIDELLRMAEDEFHEKQIRCKLLVKGGWARHFLGEAGPISDLDIIYAYRDSLTKTIDRAEEIEGILKGVFQTKLRTEDIEPMAYDSQLVNGIPKTIKHVLCTRDQTRNEVVLMRSREGQLLLYYTEECEEAITHGEAILATGNPTVTRIDAGLVVSLPQGPARMFRSAAKGQKVDFIHLPPEDVWTLNHEAKGKEPLGTYGLLLCEYLSGYSEEVKTNAMKLLLASRLTKVTTFKAYQAKLLQEYEENNHTPFVIDEERSLRDVFMAKKHETERRNNGKDQRKEDRDNCCHPADKLVHDKFKQIDPFKRTGNGVPLTEVYHRTRCTSCNRFEITDSKGEVVLLEDLPSNKIRIRAQHLDNHDFIDVRKVLSSSIEEIVQVISRAEPMNLQVIRQAEPMKLSI